MTENEKAINNIENINFKLKNLGISAFAMHFGVRYKPESLNLTDYSSIDVLIYKCEFQVPTINANLIIEFKFTPLSDGSRDVVEILTIKSIPPRDFHTIQNRQIIAMDIQMAKPIKAIMTEPNEKITT